MTFFTQLKIRPSHCGVNGRLQLARHFEMINRSVEDWFAGPLDLSFTRMHSGQQRLGIPTVHIVLDIQALPALDEVVRTSLQVVELRRSAIELEVVGRCDKQARFSARVTLIMAHAVQGRLKSMTIPAALRQTMFEDAAVRPEIGRRDVARTEYLSVETQELMSAPRLHECERPVYFQDCDPAQIVFYPRYLEMIDDVINDWLSSMGVRECRVYAVDVDFQHPSQLGEVLKFTLQILGAKDSRIYVAVSAACEGSSRIGAKLELGFPGAGTAFLSDFPGLSTDA